MDTEWYDDSDSRIVHRRIYRGHALWLWDRQKTDTPVYWHVRRAGIHFTAAEGEARTMDEAKAAAEAAAERRHAECVALQGEQESVV